MSVTTEAPGAVDSASTTSARNERLRLLLRSPTFLVGSIILLFWIFCAIFGAQVVPQDPYDTDMLSTLLPPDGDHWFGTDSLGRDIFARVICGARDIRLPQGHRGKSQRAAGELLSRGVIASRPP